MSLRFTEHPLPCERIEAPGGLRLRYYPDAFAACQQAWFDELRRTLDWRQERARLFGRELPVPRLVAWMADEGVSYRYSGIVHGAAPWPLLMAEIRAAVELITQHRFNSVLANLYRDGSDSMGWHADNEPELGPRPVVASVSLGAARRFSLRHRQRLYPAMSFDLAPGSLLVMEEGTQCEWQHQIPKTRKPVGPRINLSFRLIV